MKKFDFHVHITQDIPVEQSIFYFKDLCKRKGYEGVGIMSLIHFDHDYYPDANEKALAIKRGLPGSFAFASLDHSKDFVTQVKECMAQGFDGIKLLDGKPSCYRILGYGYEHPRFDELFAYCEENQIPMMIHNNDPKESWDPAFATQSMRDKGWYYGDGDVPTFEEFLVMLENVFARHPRLRAAIAHMGFYTDDLPRAAKLLDTYPNLYLDITPALPIYDLLCKTPKESKAFFEKYHTRLIFGTDCYNDLHDGGDTRLYNDRKTDVLSAFLEGDTVQRIGTQTIHPISLSEDILEDIYYNNAFRFLGQEK